MAGHNWSGWPGAWCLDCGREDPAELAYADGKVDEHGDLLPDALTEDDLKPCPEPGSGRFDPYKARADQQIRNET